MHVILTNPCGKTGELVRDSLQRHGVSVTIMTGPSARKDEAGYIRELKRLVRESGAEMIIPIFYPEVLAAHKNEFEGIIIPLSSPEQIHQLDDKIAACRLVSELGILQPQIFADPEEIDAYPVVFRRPDGQGGGSVYFPRNRRALDNLARSSRSSITTRYIEGYNISTDVLRMGDFFFGASYKTLLPKGKGVSTLRESIDTPKLIETARRIVESVDYQGVCGVDFRISESDGKAYFLECNPRFSGGLESAIASGFDIPWIFYRLAGGEKVESSEINFTPGISSGNI